MLARTPDSTKPLEEFYRGLPRLGRVNEMIAAAEALSQAALSEKNILLLIDAPVLEAGLSTIIIRMIQRGLVRGVAMTGTAAVRDYELAVYGRTQEDVRTGLEDGLFGLSRETGEGMNTIINEGVKRGFGLGECLGRGILDRQPRFYTQSIMAACAARLVSCTIHVTVGADGFHRHPAAEGAMLGKGSLKDMQQLASKTEALAEGGVLIAAHRSAVLHEIFYNAYAAARNVGGPIENLNLIRFGENPPAFTDLPGISADYCLAGPLELILPLFTGVLFSFVE